jgi:type IV secretion system protein VirD4
MNDLIEQSRKTNGILPRKVICLWDEFGQMPPINNIDVLFSAARSRGIRFLIALQSYAQLEKNYSQKMAQIVLDATQMNIFTYVSPNAQNTAERFSKMLDNQTIKTGSVSYSKNSSVSYHLMQRPLMYPGEIMRIPQGSWVVVKAGKYPVQTKLPFWWTYIDINDMPTYKPTYETKIIEISYLSASQLMKASKQTIKLYKGMFD